MIGAAEPGNVEDIGERDPSKIVRRHFSALVPFSDYLAKEMVVALGANSVTAAVNNFRFNESPIDLLQRFSYRDEIIEGT